MQILAFTFGYTVGACIALAIFSDIDLRMTLFALIGGLIFFGFYQPYYARYTNLVGYYYVMDLHEFLLNQTELEIERMAERGLDSKEEIQEVKDALKEARCQFELRKESFDREHYPYE